MRHRVLVVDDDPGTLRVLQRLLEALGHDVMTVATGRAAIGLAVREIFDVVLCDIHMPDLGGVEVIRRLTAVGGPARLVAMTGVPDPICAFEARAAGAHLYLAKPVQLKDLVLMMADAPGGAVTRDQSELARSLARLGLTGECPALCARSAEDHRTLLCRVRPDDRECRHQGWRVGPAFVPRVYEVARLHALPALARRAGRACRVAADTYHAQHQAGRGSVRLQHGEVIGSAVPHANRVAALGVPSRPLSDRASA